tara:strand:- start:3808 stop:4032 length:225 start_codon:yes stop_codon:yes gene_type:complete
MANSEIKHIDLASIGTGTSVSIPGFGRKSDKKKITKQSKKTVAKGKAGGVQPKGRKTKRTEAIKAPPKLPPRRP